MRILSIAIQSAILGDDEDEFYQIILVWGTNNGPSTLTGLVREREVENVGRELATERQRNHMRREREEREIERAAGQNKKSLVVFP